MRRCKLYQRDVVLVRVGVSEGAMVDDQGPGQGDKAAGDGNGKQGELEVGIHLEYVVELNLGFPCMVFRGCLTPVLISTGSLDSHWGCSASSPEGVLTGKTCHNKH